jgi:hypothetical protein
MNDDIKRKKNETEAGLEDVSAKDSQVLTKNTKPHICEALQLKAEKKKSKKTHP